MSRRGVVVFDSREIRKYPGEVDELLQYEFFDQTITVPTVLGSFGYVCISEAWKTVDSMQVCVSETWKPVVKVQVCVSEAWKDIV